MDMISRDTARHRLIVALTKDLADTMLHDEAAREEYAMNGLAGFANYDDRALIQSTIDAGLEGADGIEQALVMLGAQDHAICCKWLGLEWTDYCGSDGFFTHDSVHAQMSIALRHRYFEDVLLPKGAV